MEGTNHRHKRSNVLVNKKWKVCRFRRGEHKKRRIRVYFGEWMFAETQRRSTANTQNLLSESLPEHHLLTFSAPFTPPLIISPPMDKHFTQQQFPWDRSAWVKQEHYSINGRKQLLKQQRILSTRTFSSHYRWYSMLLHHGTHWQGTLYS